MVTIATLGSHSALNILAGAKDEGFKTLLLCERSRTFYERFSVADEIMYLNSLSEIKDPQLQETLIQKEVVLIPHGSFISYLDIDSLETEFTVPILGNKYLFRHESDRNLEREWFLRANVRIPRTFSPDEIDTRVIVKYHGAKGGKGYFTADTPQEFYHKQKENEEKAEIQIQEWIHGVTMYFHYFYSPLNRELELTSIDRRYETTADAVVSLPNREPTYVVVGNFPLAIRESLLEQVFDIGDKMVEASQTLHERGLIGPFCLETIITDKPEIVVFEISARIVAGTNIFVPYSPYSYAKYFEPMSAGRRIAREIREAVARGRLKDITT
ncbi:MAG: formate--phosphoribosylaminoimidazolecarboxamide ligase [Theionarchaea archaeon]|nr:formate--phosphoribosylaminoimidazolecarboxamide ligase [Theionarchaea archaeon]MBU7037187.1 formate--phosphoribosylaminoimidazolecarboxamide ligase [Theionarchaea archaeon]